MLDSSSKCWIDICADRSCFFSMQTVANGYVAAAVRGMGQVSLKLTGMGQSELEVDFRQDSCSEGRVICADNGS
jgi:hypothetical protein